MKFWKTLGTITMFVVLAIGPAQAERCKPKPLVWLDISGLDRGQLLIPANLANKPVYLAVDAASTASSLEGGFINEMKLPRYPIPHDRIREVESGKSVDHYVGVSPLQIGDIKASEARFLEGEAQENNTVGDRKVVGTFAHDFLRNYDVEIDPQQKKFGLYKERCRKEGAYWSNDFKVIPFQDRTAGIPVVTVEINGRKVSAGFSTASWYSVLDLQRAKRSFGLEPGKGLTAVESDGTRYQHTFENVSLGGLEFGASEFRIADLKWQGLTGTLDMMLGLKEISQLHVFISYPNEKRIYATKADAH